MNYGRGDLEREIAELRRQVNELQEIRTMVHDLYGTFMSLPPSPEKDDRTLVQEIRTVVKLKNRVSWLSRVAVWLALTGFSVMSAYALAYEDIKSLLTGR